MWLNVKMFNGLFFFKALKIMTDLSNEIFFTWIIPQVRKAWVVTKRRKQSKVSEVGARGELCLYGCGLRGMCSISNSNTPQKPPSKVDDRKLSYISPVLGVDISPWISKQHRIKSQNKINTNINCLSWLLTLLKHSRGPTGCSNLVWTLSAHRDSLRSTEILPLNPRVLSVYWSFLFGLLQQSRLSI